MMYRDTERRAPLSPSLAIRVAIMGGVALVMFGVIFFRLWYLQVLSGDKYRAQANDNQVRDITVQAPRGRIVDSGGRVLVDNRVGYAVEIDPSKLPKDPAAQLRMYDGLGKVLGMSGRQIKAKVDPQFKALPFGKATVQADVSPPVYMYVLEHQDSYPGVTVEQVFLRVYPHHALGGQLFGMVSQVTSDELKQKDFRGVQQGDRVGQSGIESSYDRYLRGADGADRVQVDALGNLRGDLAVRPPRVGSQLRLTLDFNLEQTGQNAMNGQNGAFVAMDVKTGEIKALGSSPSFDPNFFSKTIKESDYKALIDPSNGAPLTNRAIQGEYPTGSTFKLITSIASLQSGMSTPDTVIDDPGSITIGGITFWNAGHAANGAVALPQALKVSSDVYFYSLGEQLNSYHDGHELQRWASRLGLGHPTGVDLPAESPGLVPSREWRDRIYKRLVKKDPNCANSLDPAVYCRPWTVGDNVNLAVGQGDVGVSPLQLATAYATLANGGTVPRPHVGADIEDAGGRMTQQLSFPSARHVPIDSTTRDAILSGMHMAAQESGGTSYPVFKDFPIPMAGKTGTAQKGGDRPDQSWYAALAPWPNPRYVVVATFEQGGFGVETAAPAAEKILAQLLNVHLRAGAASNQGPPAGVNPYG